MNVFKHFEHLEDPRRYNQVHHFTDIIFLVVCAVISGAEGWSDIKLFGETHIDWLKKYRPFKHGIPVDDTIARIVKKVDPKALNDIFINFINEIRAAQGHELIAIDGKTLRHSFNQATKDALHSITVWSKTQGLVLAQHKSQGKKNEQQGVLELIDALILKGATVSVDAMNTQKKIAEKLIEKKANYVMALKNNHKTFRQEIESYFHKVKRDSPSRIDEYQEVNSERSRIDQRTYQVLLVDSEWLSESSAWKGIKSVIQVNRRREDKGNIQTETVFYISSLSASAVVLAESIRGHWEVENKVHWVLDVAYREDACAITEEYGAENIAILRRLALNLSRLHPLKQSMRGKLKRANWCNQFREELLFGVSK